MFNLTETSDHVMVSCSCGCFHLSLRKQTLAAHGATQRTCRCLICGTRAKLPVLLRNWQARTAAYQDRRTSVHH